MYLFHCTEHIYISVQRLPFGCSFRMVSSPVGNQVAEPFCGDRTDCPVLTPDELNLSSKYIPKNLVLFCTVTVSSLQPKVQFSNCLFLVVNIINYILRWIHTTNFLQESLCHFFGKHFVRVEQNIAPIDPVINRKKISKSHTEKLQKSTYLV